MQTSELQRVINRTWTVQELCRRCGVTPMTVYLWRVNNGLPAVVIKGHARDTVRFVPADAKAWAKSNDVECRK